MKSPLLPALLVAVAIHAAETPRLLPFQARLADATGKPIADGASVIQFQIFPEATGGAPIWAGELHRVTVNGGLVNVVLGTKNALPLNYPGDDSRPFFGSTFYLQATPDANGDGKITDDPPLLPRQAILPVLFAAESAVSRTSLDSAKLAGSDWTAVFGPAGTNPAIARLSGARLQPGSVPAGILGESAVATSNLVEASVEPKKLWRRKLAQDASLGDIAITPGTTFLSSPGPEGGVPVPIPALSLNLTTRGNPVTVKLLPANNGIARLEAAAPTGESCSVTIYFVRGERTISVFETTRFGTTVINESVNWEILDDPPAGTHNYRIYIRGEGNGLARLTELGLREVRLLAYEL